MKLNAEQSAAVNSTAPRKLVLAGPGSGKTRTLVAAVVYAAQCYGQQHVAVITFTNAAAGELKKRVRQQMLVSNSPLGPSELGFVGTLHAFCFKLLRQHGELVGLPSTLSIADADQKEGLLESVMADMGVKASAKKSLELLNPARYCSAPNLKNPTKEELVAIEYYRSMRRSGLLDFDMVLHYGLRLIQACRNDNVVIPFSDLFVDEVQDSSAVDWQIYDALPCARKFLVGDTDQAIYSFRGGNPEEAVRRATKDMKTELFRLDSNYRCANAIAKAAQLLIEKNTIRVEKRTIATNGGGEVMVQQCGNPPAEMNYVLGKIAERMESFQDESAGHSILQESAATKTVAVLARTNRLASAFAEFLSANGIPVAKAQREEVPRDWKKAKLLLTLLANPWNDMASYAWLVADQGRTAADKAKTEAAKEMRSIWQKETIVNSQNLMLHEYGISPESCQRIAEASRTLSEAGPWSLPELVLHLSGAERRPEEGQGVVCTTMHAAKGREWSSVFLVGCEEGTVPQARKDTDIEEERRLFFVAMTRAADLLMITYCKERPAPFGPPIMRPCQPSRFIKEAVL